MAVIDGHLRPKKEPDGLWVERAMNKGCKATLAQYLPFVLEELERNNEMHSCIMACTVLQSVLPKLGIAGSFPLTVKVMVLNPPLTTEFDRDNSIVHRPQDLDWEDRGYAVVKVGEVPPEEKGWPGHLVTVVPRFIGERSAMLDPTIVQASKEDFGISLSPLVTGVSNDFIAGREAQRVALNGCALLYSSFPSDDSYKNTLLWRHRDKERRISNAVARRTLSSSPASETPRAAFGKVGRNQPCPCGSGLKYKRCHGRRF